MSRADAWTQATQERGTGTSRHVPRTSFNFAASAWDAKQRQMRWSALLAGVVVVAFVGMVWKGHTARAVVAKTTADLTALNNEKVITDTKLKELTGGVTDLPALIAQRQNAVDYVFSRDVSTAAVLKILEAARIDGMEIKSVLVKNRFTDPDVSRGNYQAVYSVQVSAVGASLDMPARWQAALLALDGGTLERPEVSYSVVAGNGVTMSLTAGLADDAVLKRRTETRAEVGAPAATASQAATTTVAPK